MSFGSSAALQAAIYATLSQSAAISSAIGDAIYDAVPSGTLPHLYLTLGLETAKSRGDQTGSLSRHRVIVRVLSEAAGFSEAKGLAASVCDVLESSTMTLSRGRLVSMRCERSQARRIDKNRKRRIDLRFLALVDDA